MSNHLAISTVTAALGFRLGQAIGVDLPGGRVTNLRPNAPNGLPNTGVNIFLYQVTPNVAQRNSDLPTRRSDGSLAKRPTVALDLHYMLSFYGDDLAWEPQVLLGSVARAMHAQPVLDRATITDMLTLGGSLYAPLANTDLQDAVECVRFTPTALTFDEMSKLWGIFYQIPYILSAAYVAGPVLIEVDQAPSSALPVRSYNLIAIPLEPPVIEAAFSSGDPKAPLAPSDRLVLVGRALTGTIATTVLIEGAAATVTSAAPSRLEVALPSGIRPGAHVVQVVETIASSGTFTPTVQSNVVTFAVAPTVTSVSATTLDITIDLASAVDPTQRIEILLTELPSGAAARSTYSLHADARPAASSTVTAHVPSGEAPIAAGTYLVRVVVDGVSSVLGPAGVGTAFATPSVVVS